MEIVEDNNPVDEPPQAEEMEDQEQGDPPVADEEEPFSEIDRLLAKLNSIMSVG